MRVRADRIPESLRTQRSSLLRCIGAMCGAMPIERMILFGSHARGDAHRHSDVDLCVVSKQATHQFVAARRLRRALRDIRPKPAFTLVPITPTRLAEKKKIGDHFFQTVVEEGICLAQKD